jgi:hypothetical protein
MKLDLTLKNYCYAVTSLWTLVSLAEIWEATNISGKVLATAAVLTVSGLVFLWIKGRK